MFTADQIKSAHAKVKSGADFPVYIQELKQLGVTHYETYVEDGHSEFFGSGGHRVGIPAKYEKLSVSRDADIGRFMADLKAHQQGKTDYPTFCSDCARSGVQKWVVNILKMNCVYLDKNNQALLTEIIPV